MSAGRSIIIFVPAIDAFGGVERLILELSRFLYEERQPHTILCLNSTIDLAAYAQWPINIYSLDALRSPLAEAWALARFLRAENSTIQAPLFFDLKGAFYAGLLRRSVHLHLTDPPSLLPLDVSKHALSIRDQLPANGKKRVCWHTSLRGEMVHQINKHGVRRARTVITMTNTIATEIGELYGRRATVIRQGVRPAPSGFSNAQAEPGKIRFLSVSRLESNKRIDWILQALAKIESTSKPLSASIDWALDVVGDGSDAVALHTLANALGVSERVKFHGHVSDDCLETLFARASIFLMPAVQGYGLPALESLARGVPVILHRQSGVSEILDETPWVETIAQGPEDLMVAIRRMVDKVASGSLQPATKPIFPNAADWARQIATMCGWS